MFPPYRKSPTITSTHSLLFRWISLLPLELGLRKKMWTMFIRRYKYTKEDYVYKKVWIQMKKQFEPMSHLIPLNIKRPFQRSCQKTLYKNSHQGVQHIQVWPGEPGVAMVDPLGILTWSFKPDQNPIIGGMARFLDDGNYAKDIVEGTMFKVRQIKIVGVVKLLWLLLLLLSFLFLFALFTFS